MACDDKVAYDCVVRVVARLVQNVHSTWNLVVSVARMWWHMCCSRVTSRVVRWTVSLQAAEYLQHVVRCREDRLQDLAGGLRAVIDWYVEWHASEEMYEPARNALQTGIVEERTLLSSVS